MEDKIKRVDCSVCKYFKRESAYEGYCTKGRVHVTEFSVCMGFTRDNNLKINRL